MSGYMEGSGTDGYDFLVSLFETAKERTLQIIHKTLFPDKLLFPRSFVFSCEFLRISVSTFSLFPTLIEHMHASNFGMLLP